MSKRKEVEKIINQIVKNYKPERVILFGSFAYGKPKENSDVDLVVIKKTKKRFIKRLFEVSGYIHSWLGTDILVYTPKEWKEALEEENYFIKEIAKKGKIVYAK
ncbi:nucleotidyltransferase domain-containing protein [bacterium]|nr:nucleotidyltransferase domain-containing protein [bacterium]